MGLPGNAQPTPLMTTDLAGLANFKELGQYGLTLLVLVLTLRAAVGRLLGFVSRFLDMLATRDQRASELHENTVRAMVQHSAALSEHTSAMRASHEEVIRHVRQSAEDVKDHVTRRTTSLNPEPARRTRRTTPPTPPPPAS